MTNFKIFLLIGLIGCSQSIHSAIKFTPKKSDIDPIIIWRYEECDFVSIGSCPAINEWCQAKYESSTINGTTYVFYGQPSNHDNQWTCATIPHASGTLTQGYWQPVENCPYREKYTITGECVPMIEPKTLKKMSGTPAHCLKEGNPCDASTGNKFQTEVDFMASTLNFIRYYNSLTNSNGIIGDHWSHNYNSQLIIDTDTVIVQSGSGKGLTFDHPAEGSATSDADVFSQLLKKPDGSFEYHTTDNTVEIYNASGQLLTIRALNGLETQLSYDTEGRLKEVTDAFGQTLSFAYNTEGKISTVTTPAQEVITYSYNGPRLDTVTYPDTTIRQYLYKNNHAHRMNAIVDETGHPYARWDYDSQGRAIVSEHID